MGWKGEEEGPLREPAWEDEAGVAVGGGHTNSPCDLRSPDSLRFVCDPRGRDGDRVSNLDIGRPLPKTHCIQDSGSPCPGLAPSPLAGTGGGGPGVRM